MSWFDLTLLVMILLMVSGIVIHLRRSALPAVHPVRIHVLPGGRMPERQTEGAIGYDVYLRAIVSPFKMESDGVLRKTIFDFLSYPLPTPENEELLKHVEWEERDGLPELVYWLEPGESVLVGIGFISAMPFPMLYWVAPRSGLASKHRINLANAPGTVDPDYRGEAGVIVVNEGTARFKLTREMRIAQVIFNQAIIPVITEVATRDKLGETKRGSGGFGSTGL